MRPRILIIFTILVAAGAFWWFQADDATPVQVASEAPAAPENEDAATPEPPRTSPEVRRDLTQRKALTALLEQLKRKDVRAGETVLTFRDSAALQRFLSRAASLGLRVLGRLDSLHAVRVGFESLDALGADLDAHSEDYSDLSANLLVFPPETPPQEDRTAGKQVPFDRGVFDFLGVDGDRSAWGRGIGIAVLDSGVVVESGIAALRMLDIGMGIAPGADEGHGTAVASVVAGSDFGLAPGANVLSIRVTGADGLSDAFTLSQGIIAAADAGVRIINISMGSYGESSLLSSAIDYAVTRGIVLVASAGNDQAAQLTWPAADSRVISVGAVDAAGQQVLFSNSGDGLSMTAPGFGVPAMWIGGQQVLMDGTSISAPLVAGAIAAIMTQSPGLQPAQAWQVLSSTASDSGPAGSDPAFGNGILNFGWATHRSDPAWIDTAVASHWLNPSTGAMEFVVQNRSGSGVNGLELDLSAGNERRTVPVPWLAPGSAFSASIPIDRNILLETGRIEFRSELRNPGGIVDALPGNNRKANVVSIAK
jgi:hypothetical protein